MSVNLGNSSLKSRAVWYTLWQKPFYTRVSAKTLCQLYFLTRDHDVGRSMKTHQVIGFGQTKLYVENKMLRAPFVASIEHYNF